MSRYTFNLETAVATWRQSLKLNRAFIGDDLDELEQHLRDHIDELIEGGLDVESAYRQALRQLGNYADLEPEYGKVKYGHSKRKHSLRNELAWLTTIFTNFIKTSLRNVKRHKGYATINLTGLAVGLAGCLLMGLYVQNELSYDSFHVKKDLIYRMGNSTVGWPYGRILEAEYPEVEEVVYMRSYPAYSIKHNGQYLFESMLYAEDGFFDLFDFEVLEGNESTALELPYSAVISEALASRLFRDTPALDQTLVLADSVEFVVTGVVRIPRQSHIQFDVLLSFETLRALSPGMVEAEMANGWLDLNVVNYVLLKEGVDADAFAEKIHNLPSERAGAFLQQFGASSYALELTPLMDIYLNAAIGNALGPQSDISYVYLLSTIGLFLLLIAAINFTNLATARSADRAKEVGMRKAIGSSRRVLVGQFLLGTFMTCVIAAVLAGCIAAAALPYFNDLADTSYLVSDFATLPMAAFLVVVVLVLTLLAGVQPALLLSRFNPAEVLKGSFYGKSSGRLLRKGLVVFQFSISGVLILGTLVVWSQLRYMQNQDLGFDADQVLVLDARQAPGDQRARLTETLLDRLAANAAVEEVSSIYTVPGRNAWRGQLSFPESFEAGESISLEYFPVGWNFDKVLGLDLVAGRSFEQSIQLDATQAVVINEAAVREAGWASAEEAIGKGFASPGSRKPNGQVIGVVRDYHQHGLQGEIEPVMFGIREGNGMFAMRYVASETASVMEHAKETWNEFFAEYPYELFFLDDDFRQQYEQENRLFRIFGTFAILTIFIACLGLVGLAAFTAARRTKEIGIRKAIGATVPQLVGLLSRDFIRLVAISFVIAGTVGYFLLEIWLSEFAYRTTIGPGMFAITGVILLTIAFLSVCYQAVRAAMSDPVYSLRYE